MSSARTLITKPGLLTVEFLQGRRARYLSPLRLYLFASVAYFVVAAAAPNARAGGVNNTGIRVKLNDDTATQSRPQRVAEAAQKSIENPDKLSAAQRDSALKDLERAPAVMRPVLRQLVGDPKGFKHKIAQTMPKLLFILLPLFALIVSVFYRRRRYPEHLYFAIHLHTFTFIAMTIIALSKFARGVAPVVVAPIGIAGLLAIAVYATMAFRRVYGGGIAMTLVKEIGISFLYLTVSIFAMLGLVYWISVF